MRLDQAKRLNSTLSLDEKIELYNMTEEVLWADLDRYQRIVTVMFLFFKKNKETISMTKVEF